MEPVEEVKAQLFYSNGIAADRIHQFSCGHVIQKENLLPMTLGKVGANGIQFKLNSLCKFSLIIRSQSLFSKSKYVTTVLSFLLVWHASSCDV